MFLGFDQEINKNSLVFNDKELLWVGCVVVLIIAAVSMIIAANPNSGSIMELVQNAWGSFRSCCWDFNRSRC